MPVALGRLEATQMHQAETAVRWPWSGLAAACQPSNWSMPPAVKTGNRLIDAALSVAEAIGPSAGGEARNVAEKTPMKNRRNLSCLVGLRSLQDLVVGSL